MPLNMYGMSKHLFDLWALRNGLLGKIAGLKYFNVYGPRMDAYGAYTEVMIRWMERIEESILTKGPNVWNSLKPLHKSPLPAGELPVVPADKPRTGRPRREYLEAKMRDSQALEERPE